MILEIKCIFFAIMKRHSQEELKPLNTDLGFYFTLTLIFGMT